MTTLTRPRGTAVRNPFVGLHRALWRVPQGAHRRPRPARSGPPTVSLDVLLDWHTRR